MSMIGQSISHYKILEKLGEGGMGVVYKAEDTKLKRTVALKFLPSELTHDEIAKERFIQEARAASALDHTNICTIYEINETEDGRMFMVMPCYKGQTLKERISPLPIIESLNIAIQIAQGLSKADKQGITHRDIKPANIFITDDGVVKILDFGLAKLIGQTRLTQTGSTPGTAAYMSPEQASGEEADHRSDIWSLAVVLYEMITGILPFKGENEQVMIYSILNREPVSPKTIRSTVPDKLEQIILKALNKSIDRRYPSMHKMIEDLKKMHHEQGLEPGIRTNENTIKTLFRKPGILIPAIMISLICLFLVIGLIHRNQQIKWARNTALPEIERLAYLEKFHDAYSLAVQAEKVIPHDSTLNALWNRFSMYVTMHSQPEGAQVFWKQYADVDGSWNPLGQTPIDSIRLPMGLKRFEIEKEGFQMLKFMPMDAYIHRTNLYHIKQEFILDPVKSIPDNMVRVFPVKIYYYTNTADYHDIFPEFLMDKYEVTNADYKEFVSQGGYRKKKYWKYAFITHGRELTWEEAMSLFTDKTGREGPSTWEAGDYPSGQEDYPVSGVSWYEAAAYAEFMEKYLPTIYHWEYAAGFDAAPDIVTLSNFDGQGPAEAGRYQGMSPYGTYDMAGNVREWCLNQMMPGEKCFILGGGWNDQAYNFTFDKTAQLRFDRSSINGFRCMKYLKTDSSIAKMENPVDSYLRDVYHEKPVSDEEFNIILRMYAYPKTSLNTVVQKINTQEKDWTIEKISFDAAYGNERVITYLFLPKTGKPPYQTVIHFPGGGVMGMQTDQILDFFQTSCFDFILKNGRAVLYPVYKGTFERSYKPRHKMWDHGFLQRDFTIMCVKDLSRSIDYLETRTDIDTSKLAYYGVSWGAHMGGIMLGVEKRLKTGILYVGGLWILNPPQLPEIESLNFIPRITMPVLMLNGRYDSVNLYEMSQIPFYKFLGTPAEKKKHFVYNTSHFVPRDLLIKETLAWLDQYLGPVQ